ncbi:MAG: AzlD domain-containing protein [Thermomicrobiales bacterium]
MIERAGLIAVIALGTYVTRVVGFTLLNRKAIPARLDRALAYVPVAAFAALIVPGLSSDGNLDAVRIVAALLAAGAVLLTRQLWAALLTGMAVFWLL